MLPRYFEKRKIFAGDMFEFLKLRHEFLCVQNLHRAFGIILVLQMLENIGGKGNK